MIEFLRSTGWNFSSVPQAYGTFHLLFTIIGLGLAVLFAFLLRKSSKKTYNIILFCVGIFLLLAEIYKLTFRYFITYDQNISSWMWLVPFQLCSVPMYLALIIPFLKEGKVKTSLYTFMATFTLTTSLITFVEPSGFMHPEITLTVHAFVWHTLIFFLGLYTMLNKQVGKHKKEFVAAIMVFLVTVGIATILNVSLNNIGPLNMFYVNPFQVTPIIVFKTIQQNFGYALTAVLYLSLITFIAFLAFAVAYLLNKRAPKQRN